MQSDRDPALRAYLDRRGLPALIRYSEMEAFVLFPPSTASDGQWHEQHSAMRETAHTAADVAAALGADLKITLGGH